MTQQLLTSTSSRNALPADFARVIGFDLERYFAEHNLSLRAQEFIREALAAPSRRPSGRASNTVYYASPRLGHVIASESSTIEHPFALMTIHRADVYEVVEQPPQVDFSTKTKNGHSLSIVFTADFLVLAASGPEVWETKPKEILAAWCTSRPNVWQHVDGEYQSAPIAEFFEGMGMRFRVATRENLDPAFVRLVEHLHPYLRGQAAEPFSDQDQQRFVDFVRAHPGVALREIEQLSAARRVELASYLLAHGRLFTTSAHADFRAPMSVRLFPTPQDEVAFRTYFDSARPRPRNMEELGWRLRPGALLEIDRGEFRVGKISSDEVELIDLSTEESLPLSTRALLDLAPRIGHVAGAEKSFVRVMQEAPMRHRLIWLERKRRLQPYLPGGERADETPANRNLRAMRDRYLWLERHNMPGDEAIFPGYRKCGRKKRILPEAVRVEFENAIAGAQKRGVAPSIDWVWRELLGKVDPSELPSKRTFYRRINEIDPYSKLRRQRGKRWALDLEPVFGEDPIMGSPHGQRSMRKAHIDSTPVPMEFVTNEYRYLTQLVDSFDGRVLAHVFSAGRADGESIRDLLVRCAHQHGSIPDDITCDHGSEHRTTWLAATLAFMGVKLSFREKSSPRKGGPVESSFSAICRELLFNLEGNTKLRSRARLLTKAVDPKQFAVWTPEELEEVAEEYCALRNELPRNGKPSPNALAAACEKKWGRPPRQFANASDLARVLLPFVDGGGKRKVSPRGLIKHKGKLYGVRGFNSPLAKHAGKEIFVRHNTDPVSGETELFAFPRHEGSAIRLECVSIGGPSADIVELANQVDVVKVDRETAKTQFVQKVSTRQRALKEEKDKVVSIKSGAQITDRPRAAADLPFLTFK